jgi:hypothetical protein
LRSALNEPSRRAKKKRPAAYAMLPTSDKLSPNATKLLNGSATAGAMQSPHAAMTAASPRTLMACDGMARESANSVTRRTLGGQPTPIRPLKKRRFNMLEPLLPQFST